MGKFNQSDSRVDYGELLTADSDYELDQAVGMTYSLDMEALMGIPLCLGMGGEISSGQLKNPLYVLEAIRRTGKKLSIFCNAGCIKVPKNESRLFALLENSIHEVRMPKSTYNFHPKLWLLKYHNIHDGRILIKVVVLSRNLTFDQSMDMAVEISGFVGSRIISRNLPLADIISFVSQYDTSGTDYTEIIDNIKRVKSYNLDDCFDKCEFHPFGIYGKDINGVKMIDSKKHTNPRSMFSECSSLLIVSPFLTEEIIDFMLDNYGTKKDSGPYRRCLITRESSVNNRIFDAMKKRNGDGIWVTNPVISSNDALDDGDTYGYVTRDIHAKIYYTEKYNEANKLYIGSLNASKNAFYNNVEFLIELQYKKRRAGYQSVKNDLLPEKECPFIQLNDFIEELIEPNEEGTDFREEVYSITNAEVKREDDKYSVLISCDRNFEDVYIRPFYVKSDIQPLSKSTRFMDVPLKCLSNMFILIKDGSECLIRLEVSGMPLIEREDAVFNEIISNKPLFMAYMRYLLDEDFYDSVSYEEMISAYSNTERSDITDNYGFSVEPDIYEKMLKAAAESPERFDSMYEIAERLDSDRMGKEFIQLLELFMSASGRKVKGYK